MNEDRWLPNLLPRELLTSASLYLQGLPAWDLDDAIRVAEAAPSSGVAILGGEVWWLLDNGLLHNLMPVPGNGWEELDEWDLGPIRKQPSETWTEYCERGAKYTLEILAKLRSQEELVEPTPTSRFLYHLALWTPEWYDREWGRGVATPTEVALLAGTVELDEQEREVLLDTADDHSGLWWVVGIAARAWKDSDAADNWIWLQIRQRTMLILRNLLERGLIQAGFPTSDGRGFEPWSLSTEETIDRINREWEALGREPSLGEIVWFATTEKGDQVARKLQGEQPQS